MAFVKKPGRHVGQILTCCMCGCVFEIQSADRPVDSELVTGKPEPRVGFWFQCPDCNNAVPADLIDCTCNTGDD
jgi:hypothetical protein